MMAMSEDHALCWVVKDLTVTTKQHQALLTAVRASGGKDECQVQLTDIERESWIGTEIAKVGGYGFRDDDDCFYYHSWRNNVVIAFGTLSSFLT